MQEEVEFLEGREIYLQVVRQGLLGASEKVRIATANLKNMHAETGSGFESAVDFLFGLARRGVSVEILHGAVPSGPILRDLKSAWPPPNRNFCMRLCPRVHFKAVMVDYKRIYVGSANFTGAGMGAKNDDRRNFEVGIWTGSQVIMDRVNMLFDSIWSGEACGSCGRRAYCPVPLEEFKP